MARLVIKNGDKTYTCHDEIELCAQNPSMIILGSIVNMFWKKLACRTLKNLDKNLKHFVLRKLLLMDSPSETEKWQSFALCN